MPTRHNFSRLFTGLALVAAALITAITSTVPVQAARFWDGRCDNNNTAWGRQECNGYYTNARNNGDTDALTDDQALMDADNPETFINAYRRYLQGSRQDQVAASFTINVMLGRDGPEFGGSIDRGIAAARGSFDSWAEMIRQMNRDRLIDWEYYFSPNGPYSNTSWGVDISDVTSKTYRSDTIYSIRFRSAVAGTEPFIIDKWCANIRGNVDFPTPRNFEFAGESFVSGNDQNSNGNYVTDKKLISVIPGNTVQFNHWIRNLGGVQGNTNYTAWMQPPTGPATQAPPKTSNPARPNPGSISIGPNGRENVNSNNFTVPNNATPGQRYCQYVSYQPRSSGNNGSADGRDQQACVEVAYSYSLIPSVTASQTSGGNGDTVNFNFTITNNGVTASKTDTRWTVQEIVIQPGSNGDFSANYPGGNSYGDNLSCARYTRPGVTCTQLHDGGTRSFPGGVSQLPNNPASSVTLTNYAAGTKVCRVLTVDPPTQANAPRNRFSQVSCVIVGKRPTVHFMSGDISVGGAFTAANNSCAPRANSGNIFTATNSTTSGSTVEYGGFARGNINYNSGAGKGFGTGSLAASATQRVIASRLAFANSSNPAGRLGDSPHCLPDYYSTYSSIPSRAAPAAPLDLGSLADNRLHYSGDIVIGASNIPRGKNLIIVADGNVTIRGDINYPGDYGSVADIPSIAIITRGSIFIEENVTRINGSFVSKDTFNTCVTGGNLTTQLCNKQLVINGTVYTDKLQLRRTFGAETSANSDPAERFTYGIELLYRNVLDGDQNTAQIKTLNEQDLPPRY